MIDVTRMTQTKSLTAAVMGEAGEVLSVLGKGSAGLISDVGSLFGNVFGGIASVSVEVVRSITTGAGDIIKDTTSVFSGGIWSILGFINNILIWMAIVALFGRISRNTLLTICQRSCDTNGPLEMNPLTQGKDFINKQPEDCHTLRGFSDDRCQPEPYLFQRPETKL